MMFSAVKDHVKLEVNVGKEIAVNALVSPSELVSPNVIASSVSNILDYHLKSVEERYRENAAIDYFKQNGWNIRH